MELPFGFVFLVCLSGLPFSCFNFLHLHRSRPWRRRDPLREGDGGLDARAGAQRGGGPAACPAQAGGRTANSVSKVRVLKKLHAPLPPDATYLILADAPSSTLAPSPLSSAAPAPFSVVDPAAGGDAREGE